MHIKLHLYIFVYPGHICIVYHIERQKTMVFTSLGGGQKFERHEKGIQISVGAYTIHGYTWIEWVIVQPPLGCVFVLSPPEVTSPLSIQSLHPRAWERPWTSLQRPGGRMSLDKPWRCQLPTSKNHLWETDEKLVRQGLKLTGRVYWWPGNVYAVFCYRWSGCGFQLLYPIRSMYGLYLTYTCTIITIKINQM